MNSQPILKSPSFPYVPQTWQLNTFDDYVNFRSYHLKSKSNSWLLRSLSALVLSISLFSYLSEKGNTLGDLSHVIFVIASLLLGIGSSMLYRYYKRVPLVVMTDDQRALYKWPVNFPTVQPKDSSSSSSQQSILSTPTPNTPTLKMPLSPIRTPISTSSTSQASLSTSTSKNSNNMSTPIGSLLSSTMSPLTSSKLFYTPPSKFGMTPGGSGATTSITSPLSGGSSALNLSQIEDIETEKMTNNFNGRLFSTLSEFDSPLSSDPEFIQTQKERQERDKDKKIYEIEHIATQYYEAPIQTYRVLQKSKITDETTPKATYEEVVALKNSLWKNLCEIEHLHNMTECANLCSKWFTENIIKPLAGPAEGYLSVKDEQLLLQEDLHISTKLKFGMIPNNLDIMKNVLKYTTYHLDKLNDVHHKKENEHVCRRIVEMSKESHVFPIFGTKSNDQNDLQQPTDEQLLFALFLAYMDEKIYRDVTALNPDLPFSSKFVKEENTKYSFKFTPLINISYKRPLHCDLLVPNLDSHKLWDISPGFYNIFYTIVLFFYCITKYNNGYIENFDISQLNVQVFLHPVISTLEDNNSSSEDDE
ncbi:hypothetical protein DFA_04388 [Cavenderia fasciculata]|uniref:Transmembrane protein n=1 Tax=Cavenderia fasciculata TaxID=261658 RepID=F4PPF7_CACFS|nr:uncharacterized protein DFA_04388 [Cavenderia fasciculata]EGG22270.1 hypothetical protein DFA_04388 [Cavenderia fasciculata]|eukprot:XP_004360121.1 hypothetical protein DFA_04388 [Cavenderia fasciculata]